ncbi:hypothetical protein [Streptomyces sp. NBC_00690]|uniref:hypothetical protein n=1 Tax=Streptomyces sp. NBC_00690 TaxID=2975808 RepID=UPI002E2C759A|nr:hypothetical protein [Streptomyces sp. NBC_00690]
MFEAPRKPASAIRAFVVLALIAILPFVLAVTSQSSTVVNGELTDYSYLNLTALLGGIAALWYTIKTFAAARAASALTVTLSVALVLVAVVALFQVVRGSGMVPRATECTASPSFDLCRPKGP